MLEVALTLFGITILIFPFGIWGYGLVLVGAFFVAVHQTTLRPIWILAYVIIGVLASVRFALDAAAFGLSEGMLICLGGVVATPLTFILLPAFWYRFRPPMPVFRRYAVLFIAAYCTSFLVPPSPFVGIVAAEWCNARHKQDLLPVIHAIEFYQQTHGQPPTTLEALVPTYLNTLPQLSCYQTYQIRNCDGAYVLQLNTWDTSIRYIYNPYVGKWTGSNFLDGFCTFAYE